MNWTNVAAGAAWAFCIWVWITLSWRNRKVSQFRNDLLKQVAANAHSDVNLGRRFAWRFAALEQVSYDKMVYQFWRPIRVEEWWEDASFLVPPVPNEDRKAAN